MDDKILLVDDEKDITNLLEEVLHREGFRNIKLKSLMDISCTESYSVTTPISKSSLIRATFFVAGTIPLKRFFVTTVYTCIFC
jgi:CheY-like chemotaxis protein